MSDLRLAILDSDSGFVRVLVKRAGDLGWQYRCMEAAPRTEEFVAMRVNSLVVDLALLGGPLPEGPRVQPAADAEIPEWRQPPQQAVLNDAEDPLFGHVRLRALRLSFEVVVIPP